MQTNWDNAYLIVNNAIALLYIQYVKIVSRFCHSYHYLETRTMHAKNYLSCFESEKFLINFLVLIIVA